MEDCIFCKIVKGELPCSKVYEDENVLAFLDISPVNKGHTLVIPKEHHQNLLDIPEEPLLKLIGAVQKIAVAVTKAVDVEGFNLTQNNGDVAGQKVDHIHFHIIPRKKEDGLKLWEGKSYSPGEVEDIQRKIISSL